MALVKPIDNKIKRKYHLQYIALITYSTLEEATKLILRVSPSTDVSDQFNICLTDQEMVDIIESKS